MTTNKSMMQEIISFVMENKSYFLIPLIIALIIASFIIQSAD